MSQPLLRLGQAEGRLPVGLVDQILRAQAHRGRSVPLLGRRHKRLDDLEATEQVALCILNRLAVLKRKEGGELLLVLPDERLQLEHHACAIRD